MQENPTILFFDGECLLCNKTVQWILKNEKDNAIQFCSLQSKFAQQNTPQELKYVDSVILLKNGQFYTHFDAFIKIIPHLKWQWKWLYLLKIIPQFLRNQFYNFIARNRKKWFGYSDSCWFNNVEFNKRLIE